MAAGVRNVWFKGTLEANDYREMLADADLMVVSLVSGSGNSFFPSKLLSACSAGKPVVAICDADSELASVVQEYRCGVVVHPDDPGGTRSLAGAVVQQSHTIGTDGESGQRARGPVLVERCSAKIRARSGNRITAFTTRIVLEYFPLPRLRAIRTARSKPSLQNYQW
jgi:hypothetical protein